MKVNSILLIDDNKSDNYFHQMVIEDLEMANHIACVFSGKEALEYLRREGEYKDSDHPLPNLIIVDINMPVMNGFEFLEEFEKLKPSLNAEIVTVMLTTSKNPRDKEEAEKHQLDLFLNKPISEDELLDIVNRFF